MEYILFSIEFQFFPGETAKCRFVLESGVWRAGSLVECLDWEIFRYRPHFMGWSSV